MAEPEKPLEAEELTLKQVVSGIARLKLKSLAWLLAPFVAALASSFALGSRWPSTQLVLPDSASGRPVPPAVAQSGIYKIAPGQSNDDLMRFIARAKRQVRVVVPWFVEPGRVKDALTPVLASDAAIVEIYFLEPYSVFLNERGKVVQPTSPAFGTRMMLTSLDLLAPVFKAGRADARILTYASVPPGFIVQVDDQVLIGFHMHSGVAISNPILFAEMRRDGQPTQIGRMVEAEFTALRFISRQIDVATVADSAGTITFRYLP